MVKEKEETVLCVPLEGVDVASAELPQFYRMAHEHTSFHFKEIMREVVSVTFLFSHPDACHECVEV